MSSCAIYEGGFKQFDATVLLKHLAPCHLVEAYLNTFEKRVFEYVFRVDPLLRVDVEASIEKRE